MHSNDLNYTRQGQEGKMKLELNGPNTTHNGSVPLDHLDAAVAGGGAVAGPEDEVVHVSSEQQHCQVSPLSPVPAAHLTIFSQRSLSWLHPGHCLLLPLGHGSGNHIDFRVGMSPISPHAATQLPAAASELFN